MRDPKEIVAAGYDACGPRYAASRGGTVPPPLERLLDSLPESARVLEIGCGGGFPVTAALARRADVTAVDLSSVMVETARRRLPDVRFIAGDIMKQEFAPGSFDAIVSFYTLFHLPRDEHRPLLERAAKWLRSGGHLLVTLAATDHPGYTEPDFFGVTMYWSHHESEWYRAVLEELGFAILESGAVRSGYGEDAGQPEERHPFLLARTSTRASTERAWREVEAIETAFERGEIDRDGWHERMAALVVPAYLAADNPRAQSGYSGDEAAWEQARSMVAEAIERSGTFLDVGCASGLLMESVVDWCARRGIAIEPYGLDIAPELAALARARLPHWADRIFVGNAADWIPRRRFDFVRTGLEYVPRARRPDLVAHLLANVVAPGGRLLIGPTSEERGGPTLADHVRDGGHGVAGEIVRPHPRDERVERRLVFIDA
jgi:SAM-dependent methyltransferase